VGPLGRLLWAYDSHDLNRHGHDNYVLRRLAPAVRAGGVTLRSACPDIPAPRTGPVNIRGPGTVAGEVTTNRRDNLADDVGEARKPQELYRREEKAGAIRPPTERPRRNQEIHFSIYIPSRRKLGGRQSIRAGRPPLRTLVARIPPLQPRNRWDHTLLLRPDNMPRCVHRRRRRVQ
jgi:hypothetical protein